MKYFAYCRKSSEEDSKQVQSLDTQVRILTDYAQRNSLEIVEFIQERKSAKTAGNRLLFSDMLKRIEKGEAQGILTVNTDRLSRNMIEAGKMTDLLLSGKLQEVRTPGDSYEDRASDLLTLEFKAVVDAHYSRNLSEKVLDGIKSKLLRGEYLSQAPLGYFNTKTVLVPDPVRAPLIQEAFRLYSSGDVPLRILANILYEKGLRTKGGKKVHKSVVERLLKRKVYYGVLDYHGELFEGKHEPLVSKALFDAVQDVLEGRNRSKKQKHDFLYRDYLSCHVCGCKMTAALKKGKYRYYYCTNGKGKCTEHKHYLEEKSLHPLFNPVFEAINLNEELATLSLELYAEELKRQSALQEQMQESVQNQISAIEKKIDKLEELYFSDALSIEEFKKKKQAFQDEKLELARAQKQKPQELQTTLELLQQFKKHACTLQKMFEEGDDLVKADLLRSALWNSEMEQGKIVSTRYRKPYVYLLEMNKTQDIFEWRRR